VFGSVNVELDWMAFGRRYCLLMYFNPIKFWDHSGHRNVTFWLDLLES